MPVQTNLALLAPDMEERARIWQRIVTVEIASVSDLAHLAKTAVTETLRDAARQAEVSIAGASKRKRGLHNVGLALDFACFEPNGTYITDGSRLEYRLCGLAWQSLGPGCVWGGEFGDFDHIEFRPVPTKSTTDLLNMIDSGVLKV